MSDMPRMRRLEADIRLAGPADRESPGLVGGGPIESLRVDPFPDGDIAVDRMTEGSCEQRDSGDRFALAVHDRARDAMVQRQELHDDRIVLGPARPILPRVRFGRWTPGDRVMSAP